MKKILSLAIICAASAMMLASCQTKTSEGSQPAGISKTDVDSVSFMVGYSFGMQLKQSNFGPLNGNQIIEGIKEASKGTEIDYAQFQNIVNGFMEKRTAALAEEFVTKSEKYLAEIAKDKDVKTTESGLMYKIVREGNGNKPAAIDTVEVNYEGKNLEGKVFDSSYERDQTATFPLDRVIKGWTEGLQLVDEGGEIMLYIPAELAYGENGAGSDINPNEALTFKVELISIHPATAEETPVE